MRSFVWPKIKRSQRANFVGPSGSGKTEVATALLLAQPNAIFVDTKRAEDWTHIGEYVDHRDVYRIRGGRYVYRVEKEFLVDPARVEKFFAWALLAGNRVIYVDEMVNIKVVPALEILAVQGRASQVGLWTGSQRPSGIPLYTLSESNHTFCFRLRVDRDQARMEEATGETIPWGALRAKHSFIYIDGEGNMSGPARLSLEGRAEGPPEH